MPPTTQAAVSGGRCPLWRPSIIPPHLLGRFYPSHVTPPHLSDLIEALWMYYPVTSDFGQAVSSPSSDLAISQLPVSVTSGNILAVSPTYVYLAVVCFCPRPDFLCRPPHLSPVLTCMHCFS